MTEENATTKIVAVGDLMLGDSPSAVGFGWRTRYPGTEAEFALTGLAPVLQGADVAFGNLEVALTRIGIGESRLARNTMRGDPEYAKVLRRIGFNVIAFANNHAMQHGMAGFTATVQSLSEAGIHVAGLRGKHGWCAQPVRLRSVAGATIGVLAYSMRPMQYGTGVPGYAEGSEDQIRLDVARLAKEADFTMVSLHWGQEYADQPSSAEVSFAKRLVDDGADFIVGHHPHVVRPFTISRGAGIAYSLGNAVSDMTWQRCFRRGLAVRVTIDAEGKHHYLASLETDLDYRVRQYGEWFAVTKEDQTEGDSTEEHQRRVDDSVKRYRAAVWKHLAKNLWKAPVDIGFSQLMLKTRNLIGRVVGGAQ